MNYESVLYYKNNDLPPVAAATSPTATSGGSSPQVASPPGSPRKPNQVCDYGPFRTFFFFFLTDLSFFATLRLGAFISDRLCVCTILTFLNTSCLIEKGIFTTNKHNKTTESQPPPL